jgi:large subunit ribosomal protein L10
MPQAYKIDKVKALEGELKGYENFVFTDYRGLNVHQINALRRNLREKGAEYHVVKNRFAKRVFQDLGFEGFEEFFVNPTALVYFDTDLSEIAKILIDTAEDTTLQLKGAYSDGVILSPDELSKVSKLPAREVLVAQVLGVLDAPVRGLATVLNGVLSGFVRTLSAIQDTKNN